jgi:hypothetical protein
MSAKPSSGRGWDLRTESALTLDRAYRAVYVELTTLPKETGSQRWR